MKISRSETLPLNLYRGREIEIKKKKLERYACQQMRTNKKSLFRNRNCYSRVYVMLLMDIVSFFKMERLKKFSFSFAKWAGNSGSSR